MNTNTNTAGTIDANIQSLRRNGVKVRVCHFRRSRAEIFSNGIRFNAGKVYPMHLFREHKLQDYIDPRGGKTVLQVTTPDGGNFEAETECSKHDIWNRKRALTIVCGRLLKNVNFNLTMNKS